MERLTAHDQPFYGRADILVLDPLTVVGSLSGLGSDVDRSAVDAWRGAGPRNLTR